MKAHFQLLLTCCTHANPHLDAMSKQCWNYLSLLEADQVHNLCGLSYLGSLKLETDKQNVVFGKICKRLLINFYPKLQSKSSDYLLTIQKAEAMHAYNAITQKLHQELHRPNLAFDWLSLTLFAHWPIRMLLFEKNYLFSTLHYLKTAFL